MLEPKIEPITDMATIFRRNNSRYWWTYFTDRNGKRIGRSTGTEKKSEARDVANTLELEEKKAKRKMIPIQKEMADILYKAAVESNKGAFTVEKARSYLLEIYEIANHEALPSFTVGDWLEKWLTDKAANIKEKTMLRYSGSIRDIKKALGKNAQLPLELFSTQHAKDLREALIKKRGKARNSTINVKLTDFKSALTAAFEERMTQYNLGVSIKYLPEDDSKIVTHFEPEEVRKLIQATDRSDWKLAILLAAETGLRLSDIVAMKVNSIKFARGCLVVSPRKQMRARSKKTVTIPLSEKTMKRLQAVSNSKEEFLFPNLATKTSSTHSSNFNNLMARANIPKQIKLDNGETGHRSFHSLRHSFATWLLRANVGKDVRKSLMAHSSDDVHEIYAIHDENTLRKAIENLPTLTV
ncbi:site-specific integrase [bacterium]|nr:site-specific integrase [bacterium]